MSGNQVDDSVPKICSIFSLKNESKVRKDSGKQEKEKAKEKEKEEEEVVEVQDEEEVIQIGGGIFEEVAEGEDEESIEEFDPEDPALLEDEEEESPKSLKTVYKYDMVADSYVKVEGNDEVISVKSEASQILESENQREGIKQPNILKRKLMMPTIKNEGEEGEESIVEKHKVQKLDPNNILNMNNPPKEDGIIFVTVKGSKPNEYLLVKVNVSK